MLFFNLGTDFENVFLFIMFIITNYIDRISFKNYSYVHKRMSVKLPIIVRVFPRFASTFFSPNTLSRTKNSLQVRRWLLRNQY